MPLTQGDRVLIYLELIDALQTLGKTVIAPAGASVVHN